jgi:hypothetical protein
MPEIDKKESEGSLLSKWLLSRDAESSPDKTIYTKERLYELKKSLAYSTPEESAGIPNSFFISRAELRVEWSNPILEESETDPECVVMFPAVIYQKITRSPL